MGKRAAILTKPRVINHSPLSAPLCASAPLRQNPPFAPPRQILYYQPYQSRPRAEDEILRFAIGARRPDRFALTIAAISLLGVALTLFRQSAYGVVKSFDSVHYISMARNLLEGNGFLAFTGEYVTSWAPLVPILYAAGGLGLIDPFHVPGPMNAVMLGATALVVGIWARRRLESRFVAVCACAAVALGVPMTFRAEAALSETPFILFVTLALFSLDAYIERGGRAAFIWAVVFATLALATRYTGVFLVFACCAVLMTRRDGTLLENARRAALFAAPPFLTMAAWLVRNYLTVGIWANTDMDLGGRGLSARIGWRTASAMLEHVAEWWLPLLSIPRPLGLALGAAALGFVAAALIAALFRLRRRTRFAAILAGFALADFFGVILITYVSYSPGEDRFAAPVYVPMILLAAFGVDRLLARLRRSPSRVSALAAHGTLAALAAWTAWAVSAGALGAWEMANGPGAGWSAKRWQESETIQYLKARGAEGAVFSNEDAKALYINGDHRAEYRRLPSDKEGLDALIRDLRNSPPRETLIAWMRNNEWYGYNPSRIRAAAGVETLAALSDGWVFRLNPQSPPEDPRAGLRLADAAWDIYLSANDRTLAFVREPCGDEDATGGFALSVYPVFADDLDDPANRHGANAMRFSFREIGARLDGECIAWAALPQYDIRAVSASRIIDGEFQWGASAQIPPSEKALSYYRQTYRALSAQEPIARDEWDIHLANGEIAYLKRPCVADDVRGRFFLSVFPADSNDLPPDRKASGARHISLNFDFDHRGAIFDNNCMARVPLPDFPIEKVETGQWIPGEREVWKTKIDISEKSE